MIINLPLFVDLPRVRVKDKRVYLNLNVYRNLHHQTSNQAKIKFKEDISPQLVPLLLMDIIAIKYWFHPGTARETDTSNVCCIVDKFFCDALSESKKIVDDNYKFVVGVSYLYGGIDRVNPRVEAHILLRDGPFIK